MEIKAEGIEAYDAPVQIVRQLLPCSRVPDVVHPPKTLHQSHALHPPDAPSNRVPAPPPLAKVARARSTPARRSRARLLHRPPTACDHDPAGKVRRKLFFRRFGTQKKFRTHFRIAYVSCGRLFVRNLLFTKLRGLNPDFKYFTNNSNILHAISHFFIYHINTCCPTIFACC